MLSIVASSDKTSKIDKDLEKFIREKPNEKHHVILQLKSSEEKNRISNKINKDSLKEISDKKLISADISEIEINNLIKNDAVEKIWPDRATQSFLDTSAEQINADYLWNLSYTGKNVKIAVLDTGILGSHPMLANKITNQKDFTDTGSFNDGNGHGTHVSGIIAGTDEYGGRYKGVAPDVLLLNGKVLRDDGSGRLSWLINGIDWALDPDGNPNTDDGADVISLSLGATYTEEPEELLNAPEVLKINEAVEKGVVVVIASGNCKSGACGSFTGVTTPGIAEKAITVGAVDDNNNHASFSSGDYINDYIKPDVVAPGVNICSSYLNDDYACLTGTSMATPHVAGGVALLLEKDDSLTPSQIKGIFESNALDLGQDGKDILYGSGLIDLSKIDYVPEEAEKPKPEPGPDVNYRWIVPALEIGKESIIELHVTNNNTKKLIPQKYKVKFILEELDYTIEDEGSERIPSGKTKKFEFNFTPQLVGKYLLRAEIAYGGSTKYVEQTLTVGGNFEDRLLNVKVIGR